MLIHLLKRRIYNSVLMQVLLWIIWVKSLTLFTKPRMVLPFAWSKALRIVW